MFVLLAIAVLGLLIVVHELGHFFAARLQGIRVSQFSVGFGPTLLKYQGGDVEYALRALPLGGYVGFPDEDPDSKIPPDDPDLLKNRPILDRAIVLSAGVIANFVFAYVVLLLMVALGGVPDPQAKPGVFVQKATAAEAASKAGIKAGDVLVAIEGRPLGEGEAGIRQLQQQLAANASRPVNLTIDRSRTQRQVSVTPDAKGKIGVALTPNVSDARRPVRDVGEVFTTTNTLYSRVAGITFGGFGQLFTGKAGLNQLSGPVGIVAVTAEAAQTNFLNLFYIAALISFNLAVLNLLPLPALDGGQLAFLLIEALRGKPLPESIQQRFMQTGLVVLLGLGLVLIFKDSISLLNGG